MPIPSTRSPWRDRRVVTMTSTASTGGRSDSATTPGFGSSGLGERIVSFLREQTAVILLLVLILVGAVVSDVFLTPRNLLNILWAVSVLGIVAMGQTMLLITRNFDMSVATVMGLAGIVTVLSQLAGFGLAGSILFGLATGLLVGVVNGLLVVFTGANPFLITLGTGTLAYAISLMLTRSQTFYASVPEFTQIGRGKLFDTINYSVLICFVIAIVLQFIMRRTVFGRSLYISGHNPIAGRLSGVPIRATQITAFVVCGLTAALAGLVVTGRTGSTLAMAGAGYEFDSIIAAVLGGTSLLGGRGGAMRTLVGVLVLGVLNNLLILLNVPIESQRIAKGVVFLAVVWADSVIRRQ